MDPAAALAPCFVRGTRVLTPAGQVAVEHLAIGDVVSTANGSTRPVRWIGRRAYAGPFLLSNPHVWPVTLREGALADGVPQRDLHVSPKHAFLLDSVLVPAEALVNGASVVQQHAPAEVEYYHIELDQHDVLLAEGAPAESFMDNNSRDLFQNAAEFHGLPPGAPEPQAGCAPRIEGGEVLQAVRQRIASRAGLHDTPDAPPGPLTGFLDDATHDGLSGWACDTAHPDKPVRLEVLDGDVVVARVLANMPRPDVQQAGYGLRSGFKLQLRLDRRTAHTLSVRRASDGAELASSPRHLPPADADPGGLAAIEGALRAAATLAVSPGDIDAVATALQRHMDRLLASRGSLARARRPGRPRALVVDTALPTPDRDAGSAAVLGHMHALMRLGFDVSFAAAQPGSAAAAQALAGAGVDVLRPPVLRSVEEALRAGPFDLVYLHRHAVAHAYAGLARLHCPAARIVFSVADLEHLRLSRQAAVECRPDLLARSRAVQQQELLAAAGADAVITHSSFEADVLRQALPDADVHVVPWPVPSAPGPAPFADRRGVLFLGGFRHAPNVDAARWLVREVMPAVWRHDPALPCLLAGSDMPDDVQALAGPRVSVLGHVADLAGVFGQVRATVAPLRFGAGLKGKVVQSLAAGVPCAMTPIAAEGMDLPPLLTSLVAPDADGLAQAILRLHGSEATHAAAAAVGLDWARRTHSDAAVDLLLRDAVGVRRHRRAS